MSNSVLRLLFACCFYLACLLVALPGSASDNAQWLSDFADYVEGKAKQQNVPGYIFVFVEKNGAARIVSYGKTAPGGDAINHNTLFRLASVSKTFTSMLTAKLVAQDQLNWQTSIANMAPEYGFNTSGKAGINLQHLISQSSGYMPNAYDNLIEANYSIKRVLNELADLEPLCSPGNCYTYQNALFGVLVSYFENLNTSYQQELQRQIIAPLGMPKASVGKAALISSPNWAKPHVAIARKRWRNVKVDDDYYRFAPAAGVNASIQDMTIWLLAMLGEYPGVIPPELVSQVTQPQVKTTRELHRRNWRGHLKDAHYGLGWRVYDFDGHKLNYHGGWVRGYRADVSFAPDNNVGYAMLMNAESNLINEFTAQFWDRYFSQQKK